ncbi:MAG: Hpt domain-containing protein [Christensenellaceae bacterium]|nr:Hpt domain-containing protein [Christensenellaceae bacterium]
MNLKECYQALGGDYDGVLGRLRTERMITKFVLRFLDDKSCESLIGAIEQKNGEEAFRAAHTIKGICQNLSFDRLYRSSSALSECLRGGWDDAAVALTEQVKADYQVTVDAIRALDA